MKSIYFVDKKQCSKFMAFGQMLELMWACYAKGKELGYDDIFVEWHDKISIGWTNDGVCISGMPPPKHSVLSVNIVQKGTIVEDATEVDISEPNILYDGCPPLISNDKIRGFCYEEYLLRYYNNTNIKPTIKLLKSNNADKYVLLHYRHSKQDRQISRNVSDTPYIEIIKFIRENYSDYKIYKIGEESPFDLMVDKKYSYFLRNTDKLIELVSNSTLYIGCLSGPISIAFLSQHPCIAILSNRDIGIHAEVNKYYSSDTMYINPNGNYMDETKKFMSRFL